LYRLPIPAAINAVISDTIGALYSSRKKRLALALALAAISDASSASSCNFELDAGRERG
jgi:hypothetical protein